MSTFQPSFTAGLRKYTTLIYILISSITVQNINVCEKVLVWFNSICPLQTDVETLFY